MPKNPADEPATPRRRRAIRPAGTVGGDEANLRSSFPAPPAEQRGTPAPAERTSRPKRRRRAPDDEDVGWGRAADDGNDARLTRERPPHW